VNAIMQLVSRKQAMASMLEAGKLVRKTF